MHAMAGEHSETQWLTTTEAAKRLGVGMRTLYRLIDDGFLPGYKIGKLVKVKADELDAAVLASRLERGELKHLYDFPTKEEG
jgi:excisionase family DNA binding protein